MGDGGCEPISINRARLRRTATEQEMLEEATRDLYYACRTAMLLLREARRKAALAPLPPGDG